MTVPFTARRRAEEFDALVGRGAPAAAGRPDPRRAGHRALRRPARGRGRAACRPRGPAAPRVHRLPARAPDGGGRDRAGRRTGPRPRRGGRLVLPARPRPATAGSPPSSAAPPSSGPPRRWPSPPRPPCRATPSTPSSAPSRTPAPAWPRRTPTRARSCSPAPADASTRPTSWPAPPPRPGVPRSPPRSRLRRAGHRGGGAAPRRRTPRPATSESSARCAPSPPRASTASAALARAVPESARDELDAAGTHLAADRRPSGHRLPGLRRRRGHPAAVPALRATPGQDVGTVLLASSASIIDRGRTGQPDGADAASPARTSAASSSPSSTPTPGAGDPTRTGGSGAATGTPAPPAARVPGTAARRPCKGTVTGPVDDDRDGAWTTSPSC